MPNEKILLLEDQKELLQIAHENKLDGFVNELQEQFLNPSLFADMSFEERIKRCFEEQESVTSIHKFNSLYRASRLRKKLYIKDFTPNPTRGLDADKLLLLKDGDYLEQGLNIVISGLTGTGKTALATAAGIEAMSKGLSVIAYRMSDLITLIESKDRLGMSRFKDRLRRIKLLILDDYGLTKIPDPVVAGLNEIADARYGIGSTIITTQLKKKALKNVIDESPIRDALADRLFRDCDIEITLKGASWRGNKSELRGLD